MKWTSPECRCWSQVSKMNINKNIYRQPVKGRSNEATVFLLPGTSYKPGMLHHLDSSKKPANSEEEGITVIQPGSRTQRESQYSCKHLLFTIHLLLPFMRSWGLFDTIDWIWKKKKKLKNKSINITKIKSRTGGKTSKGWKYFIAFCPSWLTAKKTCWSGIKSSKIKSHPPPFF